MKKRNIIISILLTVMLIGMFVACSDNGSGSVTGKYFQYVNGAKQQDLWIELKPENQWIDDDGASGRFEINGETIIFYTEIMGDEEELYRGTIKDGTITITILGNTYI